MHPSFSFSVFLSPLLPSSSFASLHWPQLMYPCWINTLITRAAIGCRPWTRSSLTSSPSREYRAAWAPPLRLTWLWPLFPLLSGTGFITGKGDLGVVIGASNPAKVAGKTIKLFGQGGLVWHDKGVSRMYDGVSAAENKKTQYPAGTLIAQGQSYSKYSEFANAMAAHPKKIVIIDSSASGGKAGLQEVVLVVLLMCAHVALPFPAGCSFHPVCQ